MPDLLSHDRLVFNQKAKLVELTNEYAVRDEAGNQVGVVRQEGQSKMKKALRLVSNLDQFMTQQLAVYDAAGQRVATLTRPRKVFKSTVEVTDGTGATVGRIAQENVIGNIRFGLQDAAGGPLGQIRAENWRAWDFAVVDQTGREVARITKKWAGLGKEMFTTADNYALEVASDVRGPLRVLVLAAAAGIDTALKQTE